MLGILRIVLIFIVLLFPVIVVQALLICVKPLWRRYFWVLPRLWHKGACHILNIQIIATGSIPAYAAYMATPTLFISNHIGIRDILILGSMLPLSFVAKDDVKTWPLFGWLSQLHRTLFISRHPAKAKSQQAALLQRLGEGVPLLFFPEGTTSNGGTVLPFKSSLFQICPLFNAVSPVPLQIIPLTLTYTHVNGNPLVTQQDRDHVAYYGDMALGRHLKDMFWGRSTTVRLHIHAPVAAKDATRKELSAATHQIIDAHFTATLNQSSY